MSDSTTPTREEIERVKHTMRCETCRFYDPKAHIGDDVGACSCDRAPIVWMRWEQAANFGCIHHEPKPQQQEASNG